MTPWTAACQASLSFPISPNLLKLMSIESAMLSNHLILCHPLLFLPSIFPCKSVFSSESALYLRWPNYWCFSFSISPSNEYSGLIPQGIWLRHIRTTSVQFSRSVMSDSLQPHRLQHATLPCPSPTPRAYSSSCPLNR